MHLLRTGSLMTRRRVVPIQPTLLVYDSFRNDGGGAVQIDSRPPDIDLTGQGWTVTAAGDFRAMPSDYMFMDDAANTKFSSAAYFDLDGYYPFVAEAKKAVSFANYHEWTLRYIDADNFFMCRLFPDGGSGNSTILILERTSGVNTIRASASIPKGSASWVSDDGETISIGYDRQPASLTYSSTAKVAASKKAGFVYFNYDLTADDFRIWTGTADPSEIPS